jgi:uncharacterized protein YdeI (BOF family)
MALFMCRLLLFSLLILGTSGCGQKGKVLGKAPQDPLSTVLAIYAGDAPACLTLEGTMVEKCPQAGCWFRIDDGTGVIKVDTKGAGFVVSSVPLNTKVKVAGKLQHIEDDVQIEATGISY